MNNVLTKWTMIVGSGDEHPIVPVYKDSMSLEYERETNEQFFRCKPSEKMTLVASDARLVIEAPFDTEFILKLYISYDMGLSWQHYHTSHFYKTDCTINLDDMKVTFQPSVTDQYEKVLAGMEREYDLVKLLPPLDTVFIFKRPMSQLYCGDDNKVMCVYGEQYYEVDSNYVGGGAAATRGFSLIKNIRQFKFNSIYLGYPYIGYDEDSEYRNSLDVWFIRRREYVEQITYHTVLEIINSDTNFVQWKWEGTGQGSFPPIPTGEVTFTSQSSLFDDVTAEVTLTTFYQRTVCDVTGDWTQFEPIQPDDFVTTSPVFHYFTPNVHRFAIQYSTRFSTEPTEWGKDSTGRYFLPPDDNGGIWIPVGRNVWKDYSLWVNTISNAHWYIDGIEERLRRRITQRNCIPLWGALQALLSQIDPLVWFDNTATFSEFLYGSQNIIPWGGEIYITPKSNVLAGEYSLAAQKAPCTLKSILDMLKNTYQLYWYIDESRKFHIEHLFWFKNGGSYTNTPTVGYDTTQLINKHNGKPWSFSTSEYSFDKEDMPERYTFKWMDDSSPVFTGQPISILSKFVKEGKNEDINVSNFSSDIDLMMLQPENFSKDGFALLITVRNSGSQNVVISVVEMDGKWYQVQNSLASFADIVPKYWVYNLPSWRAKVGTSTLRVEDIQYGRKQTLTFPIGFPKPNVFRLVKTGIGNGVFQKITFTLATGCAKVQLKYRTYPYDAEQ